METSEYSSIKSLVSEIKKEYFSSDNLHPFVSPSAYDTAWLAMIPIDDACKQNGPMFKNCLNWILENQTSGGFWGEIDEEGFSSIDALPATLACMVALKTWDIGQKNIEKGLKFANSNIEMLSKINYEDLPRRYVMVFPAMIALAQEVGIELVLPQQLGGAIADIFFRRQQILKKEELLNEWQSCELPVLAYLESLPPTYNVDPCQIVNHLSDDGSLFQSPSVTASAYMATGDMKCRRYLESLIENCPNGGVPARYPVDEELIELSMVDHLQRLGLAEHFNQEIDEILGKVCRNQNNSIKSKLRKTNILLPLKLYKDSLAFRLLRMQGYDVNPGKFCWFLNDEEILKHMEENCEKIITVMYSVYAATDLQFPGEYELEEARTFSKSMLERSIKSIGDHHFMHASKGLHNVVKHELTLPWIARLDHLDHRKWIEEYKSTSMWNGNDSFYRLPCLDDKKLMQLAVENYEFRQLIFKHELEELKRWSVKWGLSNMGFGREKTTYAYYAVAANIFQPLNSTTRSIIAKAAIIVTVADDFYDMEGSLNELETLTDAFKRWDRKGLQGHSNTIFNVLDHLIEDIALNFDTQERYEMREKLRDIWRETFDSWMAEKTRSHSGYIPSMDEYLKTGMISVSAHTLTLLGSCVSNPRIQKEKLKPGEYEDVTKLLMVTSRLLNDTQSYEREKADGKINLVLLHLNENPEAGIEESIAYVNNIVGLKWKEFLKHVLMEGYDDLPKSCKSIHLACLKTFQMFFNSSNLFDSNTALVDDIKRAIYLPINDCEPKPLLTCKPLPMNGTTKYKVTKVSATSNRALKNPRSTSMIKQSNIGKISINRTVKVHAPMRFSFCFI